MSENEPIEEIAQWEDEDENNGEWPYPDRWVRSVVTGELAARCRTALNVADPEAEVTITEHVVSGGYSEYTQEEWTEFTIECGSESVTFEQFTWGDSTFVQLLKWLGVA